MERPARADVHSRSFAPVLRGQADQHRECAIYAYDNSRIGITAGEWTLLCDHDASVAPPHLYTHQIEQTAGWSFWKRRNRNHVFSNLEAGRFLPSVEMPMWRRRNSLPGCTYSSMA